MERKFTFNTLYEGESAKAHVTISLSEDNCFSCSGNLVQHNDYVFGGQCEDELLPLLSNHKLFIEIYRLWKLYHLNDLHAGTPKQEKALHDANLNNWANDYKHCCDYLKEIGLYNDNGYEFGTGWLKEEIPDNDLTLIRNLLINGKVCD